MNINLNYLYTLGYSSEDIETICSSRSEHILQKLSDNPNNVLENMKYLQKDFNNAFILRLITWYSDTFSLNFEIFIKKITPLKEAFPSKWADIVKKQYMGYVSMQGVTYIPYLEAMGFGTPDDYSFVQKALDALRHPDKYTFCFMALLSQIGINIDATDVDANDILNLECSKYEVAANAQMLLNEGMSSELTIYLLECCPQLMTCSTTEVKNKLTDAFGSNYISKLEKMYQEDTLDDELYKKLT